MRAIITVIGNDKVGIIAAVSKELSDLGINILDISQTIMQGFFTMLMLVDLKNASADFAEIKKSLNILEELIGVNITIAHEDIFNSMHKI